ncbi:hypothetical protein WJX72_010468 [[Myrmecia] bisecta]|uniref:Uncharacterized protein n=1 Tax=[Myrmecia] bisecta TaxID=41462 RepID=A0AAW1P8U3_9CHLO
MHSEPEDRDTVQVAQSENGSEPPVKEQVSPEVAKGQRTAIVTGAASIIFGVVYLVLVQILDSRGSDLKPPPPEAFGL